MQFFLPGRQLYAESLYEAGLRFSVFHQVAGGERAHAFHFPELFV